MNAVSKNVQCAICGTDAYPAMVLNEKMAIAPSCPNCGAEHRDIQANDLCESPFAPQEKMAKVIPITPIREMQSPYRDAPAFATTPVSFMDQIRERLTYLDFEIARAAGYAAERKQLARMLAAAEKTK